MLLVGNTSNRNSSQLPINFECWFGMLHLSNMTAKPDAWLDCFAPQLAVLSAPHSHAPVAQLDRASDFGSEGWGFDSLRAYSAKLREIVDFCGVFCISGDSFNSSENAG